MQDQDDSYRLIVADKEGASSTTVEPGIISIAANRTPRSAKAGDEIWRHGQGGAGAGAGGHNQNNSTAPANSNKKNPSSGLLVCTLPAVLACLLLVKTYHGSRWRAPNTWKSCHDDDDHYNKDDWESLLQQSPCSQGSQRNALCFSQFNSQDFYVWCGGYFYQYRYENDDDGSTQAEWIRSYPSIWADTYDCDELGVEGWEDVCIANGVAEEDLEESVYCSMDEFEKYLDCDSATTDAEFGYVDGEYINYGT